MTYEEKKKVIETAGTIRITELEPLDYFRLIRDGYMKTICYRHLNNKEDLYEIHCTPLSLPPWDDIIYITDKNNINDINIFFTRVIEHGLVGYIELEKNYYKIELDVVETYE